MQKKSRPKNKEYDLYENPSVNTGFYAVSQVSLNILEINSIAAESSDELTFITASLDIEGETREGKALTPELGYVQSRLSLLRQIRC
jgi:hypothetical protein